MALAGVASLVVAGAVVHQRKWVWFDEAVTLLILNEPTWGRLYTAVQRVETAPPLYHVLAHGWALLFGGGPLSLRAFTLVGLCAALLTMWGTLVRAYPWRAVAVGVLAVFCTSNLFFMQLAEVRFYGLLAVLVAVAVRLCHRLMLTERPGAGLLAANAGGHALLVLTHIYGGLYGAGLVAALVAWDVRGGSLPRDWWRRWAAPALGWLALLPWVGVYRAQRGMVARSWIEVPSLTALTGAYSFELAAEAVPVVLMAVFLATLLGSALTGAPKAGGAARHSTAARRPATSDADRRTALLFVAAGLFTVPASAFVVSRVAAPIFYGRYFIAAAFGAAILMTHLVTLVLAAGDADSQSADAGPAGPAADRPLAARALMAAGWACALGVLLAWPVMRARHYPRSQRPGEVLERVRVDGEPVTSVPIVVESAFDYLPTLIYTSLPRSAFTYVLDSATALDPRSHFREMLSYGLMVRYRELGTLGGRVERFDRFLCAHPRFVVVHQEQSRWFARRVLQDPAFTAEPVARADANPIYQPGTTLYVVRRVPGAVPRACGGAASAER